MSKKEERRKNAKNNAKRIKENKESLKTKDISKNNKKIEKKSIKQIIIDYIMFANKNLKKGTIKFLIATLVMIVLFTGIYVSGYKTVGEIDTSFSFKERLIQTMEVDVLMFISCYVPYLYLPTITCMAICFVEISYFASLIYTKGIFLGIIFGIIPLLIMSFTYSLIATHGIYVFKMSRISMKMLDLTGLNYYTFRIKLYTMLKKNDKAKKIEEKYKLKREELKNKKEKVSYINVIITFIISLIIQLVGIAIYKLVL